MQRMAADSQQCPAQVRCSKDGYAAAHCDQQAAATQGRAHGQNKPCLRQLCISRAVRLPRQLNAKMLSDSQSRVSRHRCASRGSRLTCSSGAQHRDYAHNNPAANCICITAASCAACQGRADSSRTTRHAHAPAAHLFWKDAQCAKRGDALAQVQPGQRGWQRRRRAELHNISFEPQVEQLRVGSQRRFQQQTGARSSQAQLLQAGKASRQAANIDVWEPQVTNLNLKLLQAAAGRCDAHQLAVQLHRII